MHVKALDQTYRGIQIPDDARIRKRKRRVSYGKGKRLS